MIGPRADVVGSLLRPAELVAAQNDFAAGRIGEKDLTAAEDRAVIGAIRLQEDAGLTVVTDGEMRRMSFQSQMTQAVDGFGAWDLGAFLWGDWHGGPGIGDRRTGRPPDIGVVARLRRRRHLSVDEFTFLNAHTSCIAKITLPSPGLFVNFWSPRRSLDAYPTLDGFLADVVAILRDEVAELARRGARYIQIDAPHYALLLDPATSGFYQSRGWSTAEWLDRGIELDNAVIGGFPGITFGFHLCRGNQASRWLAAGGYEAIAGPVFRRIRAERLLLEYDDGRAGSFAPLAEVPDDRTVVLGLIGTKQPALEAPDALVRRIHEAARYIPLERLALSPQCGFATSIIGNALTEAEQIRKLELVCETAQRVWG